ncbi:unnamed protein product [Ectocarpus sp. 8 AP-2014]
MKPLDCYNTVATISVSQEREREPDRENYFPPAFAPSPAALPMTARSTHHPTKFPSLKGHQPQTNLGIRYGNTNSYAVVCSLISRRSPPVPWAEACRSGARRRTAVPSPHATVNIGQVPAARVPLHPMHAPRKQSQLTAGGGWH